MVVYLSEYIHPDAAAFLKKHADVVDHLECVEDIDGIIVRVARIDREIISKAGNLKVIGKHGVGCNTIDLQAARERGITVINTPSANTNSVAELIVGLMLDISRNIAYCHGVSKQEGFLRIAPPEVTGMELSGKTAGLVGMGSIARRAGEILRGGFNMALAGYDPYCTQEQAKAWGITKYDDLNQLLAVSDIINVSVPLTAETENMISKASYAYVKKGAILINTARGGIVNEEDLYEALKNGQLRAAACDAFVKEPPNGENRLMSLDNFCATPHIGANTEEALYRMGMEVVEDVLGVLAGKEPKNPVI